MDWNLIYPNYGTWRFLPFFTAVALAPPLEETLKIAAVAICLERWPYLFRSPVQIFLGVLASAAVFSTVENLLYIHVYVDDLTPSYSQWRFPSRLSIKV